MTTIPKETGAKEVSLASPHLPPVEEEISVKGKVKHQLTWLMLQGAKKRKKRKTGGEIDPLSVNVVHRSEDTHLKTASQF
jgi:hypothetical protein